MKRQAASTSAEAGMARFKRFVLRKGSDQSATDIQKQYKISPVLARILVARGFEAGVELDNFLQPSLKSGLPHPSELQGLQEACELLSEVLRNKQGIAIACDFDVDGLSGGSQLYALLRQITEKVHIFVPDRFKDGYGLNKAIIDEARQRGCSLLVTIDFGTSNEVELKYAAASGMRSIVIDHHHVDSSHNPVDVFINPQSETCGFADGLLCAAGLVWYLIAGLRKYIKDIHAYDPKDYLDLACLGTICDMVPLRGANRVIAKRGLERLVLSTRPGLKKLFELAGGKVPARTSDVSFGIGPRVNAAGRMLHGGIVVELFTTDEVTRASELAHKLNDLNSKRQQQERRVLTQAMSMAEAQGVAAKGISVWSKEFHTGVIGIVAQRLVEKFYRPSAVMGMDEEGIFKGSVRGIRGVSVVEVLGKLDDILLKYGGHEGAGGFSVAAPHLEEFRRRFDQACGELIDASNASPVIEADAEVSLSELTFDLLKQLELFSPCGIGNKNPTLVVRKLLVERVQVLKDTHLKVILTDGDLRIEGLMWKVRRHPEIYDRAVVDVALKPEVSNFGGTVKIQGHLQAVQAHTFSTGQVTANGNLPTGR